MDDRRFATHPLTRPVDTLAQAATVLEEAGCWFGLAHGYGQPAEHALLPGVAEAPEGTDWKTLLQLRQMEAVALRLWHARQEQSRFPELGLSELADLSGLTVRYIFNGPDSPPMLALAKPEFATPAADEDDVKSLHRARLLDHMRQHWHPDRPSSPMFGLLRVLANRNPQVVALDFSSPAALLDSLMTDPERALRRSCWLELALPAGTDRPRARM